MNLELGRPLAEVYFTILTLCFDQWVRSIFAYQR
jgi:hypothetical protein